MTKYNDKEHPPYDLCDACNRELKEKKRKRDEEKKG
jgi:hypothetical protein